MSIAVGVVGVGVGRAILGHGGNLVVGNAGGLYQADTLNQTAATGLATHDGAIAHLCYFFAPKLCKSVTISLDRSFLALESAVSPYSFLKSTLAPFFSRSFTVSIS